MRFGKARREFALRSRVLAQRVDDSTTCVAGGRLDRPAVHVLTLVGCGLVFLVGLAVFRRLARDLAKEV